MRLEGKTAIVTGAGSGFGEGIAKRFAEEGASVIIADINDAGGMRVADEIGPGARYVHADVSIGEHVKGMVVAAREHFGGLDILVNNAGFPQRPGPMDEVPEDVFDRIFAVNVKSIYLAARQVIPVFKARGGGVIINIASTGGVRPRPGLTWYNGSKGAVIALTKAMAIELAGDAIRVCALNPVAGDTAMLPAFMGGDTAKRRARIVDSIPLGRLSQPRDIANSALFLASDEADFLTGVCLEVDGGRCL
jgi:3-oxoacyl-[acyl-carrier protein] reductase